jgi:hypothetical protein
MMLTAYIGRQAAERSEMLKNMLADMLPQNIGPIPLPEVSKLPD